ncbi:hypothetical protein BV25DRAFT_1806184, partial [Artomyces pyxidatus]
RPSSTMGLPISDILHRGVVTSLVGICVWGIATGYMVHRDTMRRGRGELCCFVSILCLSEGDR